MHKVVFEVHIYLHHVFACTVSAFSMEGEMWKATHCIIRFTHDSKKLSSHVQKVINFI